MSLLLWLREKLVIDIGLLQILYSLKIGIESSDIA